MEKNKLKNYVRVITHQNPILIFAMPGTGKTYFAKTLNAEFKPSKRPIVDFDYRGPRFINGSKELADLQAAQCQMFKTLFHNGVKIILTHYGSISNRGLHELLDVIPNLAVSCVVGPNTDEIPNKVLKRDGNSAFSIKYAKYYNQYRQEWIDWAKAENIKLIEMRDGQTLFDIYSTSANYCIRRYLNPGIPYHSKIFQDISDDAKSRLAAKLYRDALFNILHGEFVFLYCSNQNPAQDCVYWSSDFMVVRDLIKAVVKKFDNVNTITFAQRQVDYNNIPAYLINNIADIDEKLNK